MNKICLLLCCLLPGLFRAGAQELKMTECAPLTQIYGEVCESDELLPMGDVGVEFGYVLYQAAITVPAGEAALELENVRDYAAVYLDGVFQGTLTDNRNRTAANMRHYFDKFGGNLGQMGCVGFMFTQKGVIVVDLEDRDPDELMMDALDAGADDFDAGEDAAEVTTSPENFTAVCEALEKKGYKFISADVAQVPSTTTALTDPDQLVQMGKLLDALDDDDDVQNAWHTLENEEDLDR